jgi:hypothetical protein
MSNMGGIKKTRSAQYARIRCHVAGIVIFCFKIVKVSIFKAHVVTKSIPRGRGGSDMIMDETTINQSDSSMNYWPGDVRLTDAWTQPKVNERLPPFPNRLFSGSSSPNPS